MLRIGHVGLAFDRGCFHGLPDAARDGYARGATAVTRPGAVLLLMAFRGPTGPGSPRGASPEEAPARFGPPWRLVSRRRPRRPRPLPASSAPARLGYRFERDEPTATCRRPAAHGHRRRGPRRRSSATPARPACARRATQPAWFDDVEVQDEGATDSQFGVGVGRARAVARGSGDHQLEQALKATLQGLRRATSRASRSSATSTPEEAIDLRVED